MTLENYLHLTWAGYGNDKIFDEAKENIQKAYDNQLNKVIKDKLSQTEFKEAEAMYRARAQGIQDLSAEAFEAEGYDEILKDIDYAVQQLTIKRKKIKNPETYIELFNKTVIPGLKKITDKYVGNKEDLAELEGWISDLQKISDGKIEIDQDLIKKVRNYLQKQVSGLALEVFLTAAFLDANNQGLNFLNLNNEKLENIIHAGNKSGVEGISRLDEKIAEDVKKGKFGLEQINREPGVDVILKYTSGKGGSLITSFEGLQLKNYSDISRIPFGGRSNLTLKQLDISNFFNGEYNLVNAAAAFGKNVKLEKYPSTLINEQPSDKLQKDLNNGWISVMSKARQLASVDAVINNNLSYLNQASYFVIRSKKDAKIIVITKYDIIKNIKDAFEFKGHNEIKGITWRYKYTDEHKKFLKDTEEENAVDSQLRSEGAYPAILQQIYNTKMSVAFNAANLTL